MNTTLSTPRTISIAVSVRSATRTSAPSSGIGRKASEPGQQALRAMAARLARAGLDVRLAKVCVIEGRPAAVLARGRRVGAMRDRAAGLAAEMPLAAGCRADDRAFEEQIADDPELVRDLQRLHAGAGLVRLHELAHERVQPPDRIFHNRTPVSRVRRGRVLLVCR